MKTECGTDDSDHNFTTAPALADNWKIGGQTATKLPSNSSNATSTTTNNNNNSYLEEPEDSSSLTTTTATTATCSLALSFASSSVSASSFSSSPASASSQSRRVIARKNLTLANKLAIIDAIDAGLKQSDVAAGLNMSTSTINTIWSKRKQFREILNREEFNLNRKRRRTSRLPEIETALHQWCTESRAKNIPINGPKLIEVAQEVAAKMGIDNFIASSSWLDRFKLRKGIQFNSLAPAPPSASSTSSTTAAAGCRCNSSGHQVGRGPHQAGLDAV